MSADSIPAGPWAVDPSDETRVLDTDGNVVLTAASPFVARYVTGRVNSLRIIRSESIAPVPTAPTLDNQRMYRTLDEVAAFLPEGTRPPPLPTFGFNVKAWIKSETERLADPEAWEAKREHDRLLALEVQRVADETARTEAYDRWVTRAIARGCPPHAPSLRAPSVDTLALASVKEALAWYRANTRGALSHGGVVVLWGRNGSGKTTATTWGIATYPGDENVAIFITAQALAGIPLGDWSTDRAARERLLRAKVLVIDECAAELAKDAGLRVAGLTRNRYDTGKLTILTTNIAKANFAARYFCMPDDKDGTIPDERFASRFREQKAAGLRPWVPLPSEDLRGTPPSEIAPITVTSEMMLGFVPPKPVSIVSGFAPTKVRGR